MIDLPSISLEDWHTDGETFNFRRHEIFFKSAGPKDAPALLLLHGFPTCSWDYAWIWESLIRDFRVIVPDLLDYGWSVNRFSRPQSIMDQADMIESLLEFQGIKSLHILAHDVGDTVAQELLARRQYKTLGAAIKSLVFLNGGMLPHLHRPRPIQTLFSGPLGSLLSRFVTQDSMTKGLAAVFGADTQPSAALNEAFWSAIIGVNDKRAISRRLRYMAERRQNADRWVGALVQPDVPMMLINGTADPVSGAHAADGFDELVKHAEIVRLDGIGHFPQIEAPAETLAAFQGFHAKLSGS